MNSFSSKRLGSLLLCTILSSIFFTGSVQAEESLPEYQLETINVTAMGYKQKNLETAADVTTFTGEQLKQTGASNVAEALKYKTGIYFTSMGPHGQNWITNSSQANLRGIDKGTLVLINGVPASFNQVTHLDMLNLEQIEKVEVVKGGGAVLYGSEAFGGVINVITKEQYKNTLSVATGSSGQREYAINFNAGKANVAFSRSELGETEDLSVAPGTSNGVKYNIKFGDSSKDSFNVAYKFNENLKLNYIYNEKTYTTLYNRVDGKGIYQHFDYKDRESFLQLDYNNNDLKAKAFFNYRETDNTDYRTSPYQYEWEYSNSKAYGVDVNKTWQQTSGAALLGATVKKETYADDNLKFGKTQENLAYQRNNYSVYGSWNQNLSKATNLVFSAREDMYIGEGSRESAFLPQVQVLSKLNTISSVYASAGKAFKMPTFRNLHYKSSMIMDNPNLKPESGWNYEIGYKYEQASEKLNVALFRTDLENQIISIKRADLGANISQSINAAKYKNIGLEANYEKQLDDNFSYNVGFTVSNPERKIDSNSEWIRAMGRYQIATGLNYVNKDTTANLSLSYWGDRVYTVTKNNTKIAERISSPLLVSNLNIGHRLSKDLTLNVGIDNIFDRKDIGNADTGSSLYYTLGRTFKAGLTYNF